MIAERLAGLRARMDAACARAGRDPASVQLLAVSKTHPVSAVQEAHAAGQRLFGENYVQAWRTKAEDPALVGLDLQWHYIGALQTNKVRFLVGRVALIETVDRMKLAREIGKRAAAGGRVQGVLLQVNTGGESSKAGFAPDALRAQFAELLAIDGLGIRGLMHIPPPRSDAEATRADHRSLRALRDQLEQTHGVDLPELSMGMSGDFEVAIEEGATLVRIGTAIFGAREG